MKPRFRFGWLAVAVALAGAAPAPPASAQQFPARDITWIVPFAPGGGGDVWARALARSMEKEMPRDLKIVVKNVTGAGGRVGTIQLFRSKPDGYTIGSVDAIGLIPYQMAVGPEKAGYDLGRFAWIGFFSDAPNVVVVRKDSPLASLREVKEQGAKLRWGVLGPGEGHWMGALVTTRGMGLPFNIVSGYKGAADLAPALMRGDFDVAVMTSTSILPLVKSGDLRVLATLADERFPGFPEAATAKELGVPVTFSYPRAAAAAPGTPPAVLKTLEGILLKALKDPELLRWAEATGRGPEMARAGGTDAAQALVERLFVTLQRHQKDITDAMKVN